MGISTRFQWDGECTVSLWYMLKSEGVQRSVKAENLFVAVFRPHFDYNIFRGRVFGASLVFSSTDVVYRMKMPDITLLTCTVLCCGIDIEVWEVCIYHRLWLQWHWKLFLCCWHGSEISLFRRNNRRLTSGHEMKSSSHTHLERQWAHDRGLAHCPSIVQRAFAGKKWSVGSCVSFETASLTSMFGTWVMSDSQHCNNSAFSRCSQADCA